MLRKYPASDAWAAIKKNPIVENDEILLRNMKCDWKW